MSRVDDAKCCLMCGTQQSKFTGEHVFPKWLRAFFPIDQTKKPRNRYYPDTVNRDAGTEQIRQVCAPCNNEWMSALQTKAKEIFTRFHDRPSFEDEPSSFFISIEDADILVKWAVMTTMVIELLDDKSNAIPLAQRVSFAANHAIDPTWRVWLSQSCGGPERGFTHKMQKLDTSKGGFNVPEMLRAPPTTWQVTTFVAARAIFVSTSGIVIPPAVEGLMKRIGFVEITRTVKPQTLTRCIPLDQNLLNLAQVITSTVAQHYAYGSPTSIISHSFSGKPNRVR